MVLLQAQDLKLQSLWEAQEERAELLMCWSASCPPLQAKLHLHHHATMLLTVAESQLPLFLLSNHITASSSLVLMHTSQLLQGKGGEWRR